MPFELGKDWRLFVGSGTGSPETFSPLGGEGTLDVQRASDDIDLSSKDDATYKSGSYGLQAITLTVGGKCNLPDTALARLEAVVKSGTPNVNIQIRKGATTKFACPVAVGNLSWSGPQDGPCTYSFNMRNNGAPTVDALLS